MPPCAAIDVAEQLMHRFGPQEAAALRTRPLTGEDERAVEQRIFIAGTGRQCLTCAVSDSPSKASPSTKVDLPEPVRRR